MGFDTLVLLFKETYWMRKLWMTNERRHILHNVILIPREEGICFVYYAFI
jgi:hypothetical protein